MAAAAFKATLTFVSPGKPSQIYACTVSDVAAAHYVFPDGNGNVILPPGANWTLRDIILSAAGTDTSKAEIYVGGNFRGYVVSNAANLGTNPSRQFLVNPLTFMGGSMLDFVQRA